MKKYNKIKVLLLDDRPQYAWNRFDRDVVLPKNLRPYFDLSWIESAKEAKWLFSISERIESISPKLLSNLELPFEIIIFDYDLSEAGIDSNVKKSAEQSSNIFSKTCQYLDSAGYADLFEQDLGQLPEDEPKFQRRNAVGCLIGVLATRIFRDHPVAAIPTTAHMGSVSQDVTMFEWLNDEHLEGEFEFKSRIAPELDSLIFRGVTNLRKRILRLLSSGNLHINITSLITSDIPEAIELHGKYGHRRFLFKSLFPMSTDEEYLQEAIDFKNEILHAIFKTADRIDSYKNAQDIAENYYKAGTGEIAFMREQISSICLKEDKTENDHNLLKENCNKLDFDYNQILSDPKQVDLKGYPNTLPLWRKSAEGDDLTARWAVLMIAILCEKEAKSSTIPGQAQKELYTKDEANKDKKGNYVEISPGCYEKSYSRIHLEDQILKCLEPLPESLFYYMHRSENPKSIIKNPLKRLGHTKTGWGPLGVDLKELLSNSSPTSTGKGLRYSELGIVRSYAHEIGFDEAHWPLWMKNF